MRDWMKFSVLGIAVLLLAGSAAPPEAWAQHGMPRQEAGAPPPQHMLAQMYATAFEKNIGEGRGFGMAFVADQNGYPGPLHVLELKELLKLTSEQEAKVREALTAMFAQSKPKGARLLEAEEKLRRLFASGQADETSVRAAAVEVEQARSELRMVHLTFHLKTREVLTDEQRRLYHEARWSPHQPMGPHGGGSPGASGPMK
jgi:Spy/CpxP family protein refolding chaperone